MRCLDSVPLCWTKSPWFRIEPIGSSLDRLPSFYRKLPHKCFSTTRKKIFLLSDVMLWNFFLVGLIYSGIVVLFCFICYIWETVSSISLYFIGGLWGWYTLEKTVWAEFFIPKSLIAYGVSFSSGKLCAKLPCNSIKTHR